MCLRKYTCCHCGKDNRLTEEQTATNQRITVPVEGDPGDNGNTPYIGPNDNWWIDGEDLGIPAIGQPGETPYIGDNGNWWIGETDTGVEAGGAPAPETDEDIFE